MRKLTAGRLLCFAAALMLMVSALCMAVCAPVSDPERFAGALRLHVSPEKLETDAEAVDAFARETIRYISGRKAEWEPSIRLFGRSDFIPERFRQHMAEMRDAFLTTRRLHMLLGIAAILLLGLLALRKLPFRRGAWFSGLLLPLLLIAAAGLWAAIDFDAMWYALHRYLIPNGIFPASEPVMLLFPENAFLEYLTPVVGLFFLEAALLLVPALLIKARKKPDE